MTGILDEETGAIECADTYSGDETRCTRHLDEEDEERHEAAVVLLAEREDAPEERV